MARQTADPQAHNDAEIWLEGRCLLVVVAAALITSEESDYMEAYLVLMCELCLGFKLRSLFIKLKFGCLTR